MVILGAILTKRMTKKEVRKSDGSGSEYCSVEKGDGR
jgi:hypothetical protein